MIWKVYHMFSFIWQKANYLGWIFKSQIKIPNIKKFWNISNIQRWINYVMVYRKYFFYLIYFSVFMHWYNMQEQGLLRTHQIMSFLKNNLINVLLKGSNRNNFKVLTGKGCLNWKLRKREANPHKSNLEVKIGSQAKVNLF